MAYRTRPPDDVTPGELVGAPIQRREDAALMTGAAEYTDDIQDPDEVYLALLRSQYAHATITAIETNAAESIDGVLEVYTAADIEASGIPATLDGDDFEFVTRPARRALAAEKVRYQGEPIAAVVAEDRYAAAEARDRIEVSYERLEAVVDPNTADHADAPTIHECAPDNVCVNWETGDAAGVDDAIATAAKTVEFTVTNNRVIATPMETRVALARYSTATGELDLVTATQMPHHTREHVAASLGLPEDRVRVRSPDVGGGFGVKVQSYPGHILAAWCAMQLDRPVKWKAGRAADFLSTAHSREQTATGVMALDEHGEITGVRVTTRANIGAYLTEYGAFVPTLGFGRSPTGPYDIPAFHLRVTGVFTNTTPLSAYRGAGRPEACYVLERGMAIAARELGVDPVEFRRRHFIPPSDFPYKTPVGHEYDSGDYEKALDTALEMIGYDDVREHQGEARDTGTYRGVGVSCYVEGCGSGPGLPEGSRVTVRSDGGVTVHVGTHDHGQGHKTSFSQIVADELGVPFDDIEVIEGDTGTVPDGHGTGGSRSGPVGGSAVFESAEAVREQARELAARHFEVAVEDVEFADGDFHVTGVPDRAISIQAVAELAASSDDPGLEAESFYDPPNYTYPFGTHIAEVAVDVETGDVSIERYVAVDDVGTRLNPKIVDGQIHGGIAQGIGQALFEGAVYDANGNLLTGSFQDYAVPKAGFLPEFETAATVTECPHNPLGVKGVGEAGAIAAPPAVVNAVVDALAPFGVASVEMPVTGETVWRAIAEHREA